MPTSILILLHRSGAILSHIVMLLALVILNRDILALLHVQVGKRRVPVDIFQQNLEHLTLIAEPFFLAVPNDCYQICVGLALCAQQLAVSLVQE